MRLVLGFCKYGTRRRKVKQEESVDCLMIKEACGEDEPPRRQVLFRVDKGAETKRLCPFFVMGKARLAPFHSHQQPLRLYQSLDGCEANTFAFFCTTSCLHGELRLIARDALHGVSLPLFPFRTVPFLGAWAMRGRFHSSLCAFSSMLWRSGMDPRVDA